MPHICHISLKGNTAAVVVLAEMDMSKTPSATWKQSTDGEFSDAVVPRIRNGIATAAREGPVPLKFIAKGYRTTLTPSIFPCRHMTLRFKPVLASRAKANRNLVCTALGSSTLIFR